MCVNGAGSISYGNSDWYSSPLSNGNGDWDSVLSGLEQSFMDELNRANQQTAQGDWAGSTQLLLALLSLLSNDTTGTINPASLYTGLNVGPASGNSASAQPLSSGQRVQAKQIYDYLISKYHLTPAQAAGVVGNMQVESSLNTGAYNSAEGAIGLVQWEGGRRTALEQYAASQGKPVTDWKVQVDFMMHEMQTTETRAYSALKAATTPGEAAAAFDQYYERSAGTSRGQRIADAQSIFRQMAA